MPRHAFDPARTNERLSPEIRINASKRGPTPQAKKSPNILRAKTKQGNPSACANVAIGRSDVAKLASSAERLGPPQRGKEEVYRYIPRLDCGQSAGVQLC